jgi:3-deoxy-7-phosphoheptulonate synthase
MRTSLPSTSEHVRDQRIEQVIPLVTPALMLHQLPLTPDQAAVVLRGREDIAAILDGADDRLLAVVGPCSVHDVDAAREYARLLSCASRCASTSRSRERRSGGRA